MCGIAGIIGPKAHPFPEKLQHLMSHRGPDNTKLSYLQSGETQIQILHHRLSIIDLSEGANQPFFSEDKNFGLVFNGEIYNYVELRKDLEKDGVSFRTSSDTEVLLKLLIRDRERAFSKLNGMFALGFFDLKNGTVIFGRDPFGEKPLYYFQDENHFYFSSEIKFILEAAPRKFKLNGKVIGDYFSSHFLEARIEETFFAGIRKLPPGTFAVSNLNKIKLNFVSYYEPKKNAETQGDLLRASEDIRETLFNSVDIRLRSDVPVGLFLSGGVDSSVLAAISSQLLEKNGGDIKFLSIVSDDPTMDESPFIDIVSKHLKKESIKVNVHNDAKAFWELLPKVIWHNDEPIISFASIAYYKMIEAARAQGLKVLLTGQGADEVFLGYKKFKFWHYKNLLKKGKFLQLAGAGISELQHSDLIGSFSLAEASRYFPGGTSEMKTQAWGEKLLALRRTSGRNTSSLSQTQYDDLKHYSVPVLLHYEDRLSMAFGAEVRVPFLDKNLVDIGMNLKNDLKIHNGWSKYALRKSFETMLPKEIIWRKDKKGFTIPQEEWMKQTLAPEIQGLFASNMKSYDMGLLDKKKNLEDYGNFQQGKTKLLGFKDIFARLSLEKWMDVYGEYIESEIEL